MELQSKESFSVVPLLVAFCTLLKCIKFSGKSCMQRVYWPYLRTSGFKIHKLSWSRNQGSVLPCEVFSWWSCGAMTPELSHSGANSTGPVERRPSLANSFLFHFCPWEGVAQLTRSTLLDGLGLLSLLTGPFLYRELNAENLGTPIGAFTEESLKTWILGALKPDHRQKYIFNNNQESFRFSSLF